jgi:translation initiation factor IF-2
MPVEVLGFDEVPNAGDKFRVMESEKEVRQISERRSEELRRMSEERKKKKITLEDLHTKIKMGAEKKLFLIIKGDGQGSVGALSDSISKLSAESEINVQIIHKDVGDITESDVLLADASNAVIIGFFVAVNSAAKELAKKEDVEIKIYHIIYEVVDAIKASMEGLLEPEYEQVKIGEAEVRQIFKMVSEDKFIAGSYIKSGNAYNDSIAAVYRGGYEILKGNVLSLRRFKDSVKEVKEGYECGVIVEGYREPKEGDVIVFYEERQKVKKL